MFYITLHFLQLLAFRLLAHTPAESLVPSVHPAHVTSHLQILWKNTTGCRWKKTTKKISPEILWPRSAFPLFKVFPQKLLTRRDAPESFSCSSGSFSRRRQEGCSIVQVSVELRLHCILSCVCQHSGVSTSSPAAAAESLSDNFICSAVWNTAQRNNLNCTSIVFLRFFSGEGNCSLVVLISFQFHVPKFDLDRRLY